MIIYDGDDDDDGDDYDDVSSFESGIVKFWCWTTIAFQLTCFVVLVWIASDILFIIPWSPIVLDFALCGSLIAY